MCVDLSGIFRMIHALHNQNDLEQGDAVMPLLFNFAFELAVWTDRSCFGIE